MLPPTSSPAKRPWQQALLLCGSVLVGLAMAEVGLRLWFGKQLMFQPQWGLADDSVEKRAHQRTTIDNAAFSYDEYGFRSGSGLPFDRTVLFIGDSFTEGFGVGDDDTFARATERALRRGGIRARSLNAGHHGFGAAQELKVLRRMLARLPVDGVVVQSFPMNDVSDNIAFGGFDVGNGHLVENEPPRPPLRARLWGAIARTPLRDLYILRLTNNAMLRGDPAAPFDSPTGLDLERALLRETVAAIGARPFVMLVVPTRLVQEVQHGARPSSNQVGELRRFEAVCELMKEMKVPWIDAGEVITDLAADAAKSDGGHFSRDGNALLGDAIALRLERRLQAGTTAPPSPPS